MHAELTREIAYSCSILLQKFPHPSDLFCCAAFVRTWSGLCTWLCSRYATFMFISSDIIAQITSRKCITRNAKQESRLCIRVRLNDICDENPASQNNSHIIVNAVSDSFVQVIRAQVAGLSSKFASCYNLREQGTQRYYLASCENSY